ncbi:hypothetical protein [Sphingobacterium sp. SGR-19]|uniref:hypothetical protein n=1 Tax=Sphingobacterium sp. SGR-19 TaxID=2710886 RepID=UPI0013EAD01E|nr:hypothetical protein [Sphingobacterium sp. SGR-19]NGM66489.1 hypothetical protein [Sphingobacterium sp. SGR-19]
MLTLPISGEKLLTLIPQRAPIVLVSSLESYNENVLVSTFLVRADDMFVDGEKLSESGLLEHMAQSVALHTGYSYFLKGENAPMGYIGSMQNVEIRKLPTIGETVFSRIQIIQEFMGVTLVEIETKLDGEFIARARMKTVVAG